MLYVELTIKTAVNTCYIIDLLSTIECNYISNVYLYKLR
jgi:hypothetical protein